MPSNPSSNTWNRPTGPPPMTRASTAVVGVTGGLPDQFAELAGLVLPVIGIGLGCLALGDAGPALRQLGIERDHVLLVARHVFLRHDRVDRALGNADGAIDALVGID